MAAPRRMSRALTITFGDAFGGPHDTAGIDRLVGGNQDHGQNIMGAAQVGDVTGADGVGENALGRVGLDNRHMFHGGGVENQLRAALAKDRFEPRAVADVGHDSVAGQGWMVARDRLIDGVEIEFRIIHQAKFGGAKIGDLAHQFAANGPAGTGDQDTLAGDQALHGRAVEHHARPAEQILDIDRSNFDRIGRAGFEFGEFWQLGQEHAGGLGQIKQLLHGFAADLILGNHQAPRLVAAVLEVLDDRFQLGKTAENGHIVDAPADPRALFVNDTNDAVGGVVAARHGANKSLGGVACSDEENRHTRFVVFLKCPIDTAIAV